MTQIDIAGTELPVYRLLVIGIAALVYVGIWAFLNRTIIGKAIRAGIENVEHVEGLGINVYKLFTITFIVAGALSGLAGGLHAPLVMVDPHMGLHLVALVFMVVIIGGLGCIKGTLVSAFLVGQVTSIGSLIYAPLVQMAPFAIMLLILLITPTGLYGSTQLRQRVAAAEQRFAEERTRLARPVLGRRAILRQSWRDSPTSPAPRGGLRPRVAARDVKARVAALLGYREFLAAYRRARALWLAGQPALFPFGTYWLRWFANVPVAPPPLT